MQKRIQVRNQAEFDLCVKDGNPDCVTQENKRLKEIIMVIDYCLSDYVITEDGIKIVNAKNLDDAQDLLKETVKKFKI